MNLLPTVQQICGRRKYFSTMQGKLTIILGFKVRGSNVRYVSVIMSHLIISQYEAWGRPHDAVRRHIQAARLVAAG